MTKRQEELKESVRVLEDYLALESGLSVWNIHIYLSNFIQLVIWLLSTTLYGIFEGSSTQTVKSCFFFNLMNIFFNQKIGPRYFKTPMVPRET